MDPWCLLRGMFRLKNEDITGGCKQFHEECHESYASTNSIIVIKPRKIRWAGYAGKF
jgi:hypothetical protein